ncbi:protein NKG7-like [Emydura macquarii macquarii]|uniref:protein NKG7-like n=1 Tax=Emydura macquarii macquarii TaxID=1129001 RepID=UPI00352A1D43
MLPLRILSAGLALLSLLLLLVALGSDHWLVARSHPGSLHAGLWKSCLIPVCVEIAPVSVPLTVTRAFMILAAIAGFFSSVALLALFLRTHLGSVSLTVSSCLGSFSAGLCALIAMALYTGEHAEMVNATQGHSIFGWSFGLAWAAFPLFLITGVVTLATLRAA